MSERVGSMGLTLAKGITPAGSGKAGPSQDVVWNILGHTYWLKAECDGCFIFETLDPPGTFVPPHIHPTQDEFIYMLDGTFDLYLDGAWTQANAGDLVRMPKGLPHAYYNKQSKPARALFSVSPARRLRELFDQLHNLTDPEEVVRRSQICEVDFLPPGLSTRRVTYCVPCENHYIICAVGNNVRAVCASELPLPLGRGRRTRVHSV